MQSRKTVKQRKDCGSRRTSWKSVAEVRFAGACRAGEAASEGLTEALLAFGFETDRLKTGTPARVDKRTIDYTHLEAQPGDEQVKWFSFDEGVRPDTYQH